MVPGYVTCPKCNDGVGEIYVSALPDENGGWYQCDRCGFNGDSVALLADRAGVGVEEFLRKRRMADSELYSSDRIADHRETSSKMAKLAKAWRKLSERTSYYTSTDQEIVTLLSKLRMDAQFNSPGWRLGMGTMFGVATARTIADLTDISIPGPKGRAWVVNPIYGAPGFMIGMVGIDASYNTFHAYFDKEQDGLGFLRKPIRNETVFGLGSAPHAFALQILAQNHYKATSLPIVCYGNESLTAWNHLLTGEVVLWDVKESVELFVMARRIGDRARVAFHPFIPEHERRQSPYDHFNGATPETILQEMKQASRPWLEALKDYILARAETGEITRLPDKVSLSPLELERIQGYCRNSEERKLFNSVYTGGPIEISITLGSGKKITQKADGWHRPLKKGSALLTSAMPVIEDIITSPGVTLYSGYIRVGNSDPTRQISIPFRVPAEEFTTAWLQKTCTAHKHFVDISSAIGGELYDIATRIHRPRVVSGLDELGWDSAKNSFVFPAFTIRPGGDVTPTDGKLSMPHPSEDMEQWDPPEREEYERLFKTNPGQWRAYLAGLYTIIAPALGLPAVHFAVKSNGNNLHKFTEVALALNMPDVFLENTTGTLPSHGHTPVFVTSDSIPRAAALIKTDSIPPTILSLCGDDTARLALLRGWAIVDDTGPGDANMPGMAKILFNALRFLQSRGYRPDTTDTPLKVAADLIRRWARFTLEAMCPVLDEAEKGYERVDRLGDRIFMLVNDLIRSQHIRYVIKQEQLAGGIPSVNDVVHVGDTITIPCYGLQRAAARASFPLPDAETVGEAIRETDIFIDEIRSMGTTEGWRVQAAALNR